MEVAEDGSSSIRHFEATVPDWHFNSDLPQSDANHFDSTEECERITLRSNDHAYNFKCQSHQLNGADTTTLVAVDSSNRVNGVDYRRNGDNDVGFKKDVGDLEELLSKLIPMAEEFMPLSLTYYRSFQGARNALSLSGTMLGFYPIDAAIKNCHSSRLTQLSCQGFVKQMSNCSSSHFVGRHIDSHVIDAKWSVNLKILEIACCKMILHDKFSTCGCWETINIQLLLLLWSFSGVSPSKTPVLPRLPRTPLL